MMMKEVRVRQGMERNVRQREGQEEEVDKVNFQGFASEVGRNLTRARARARARQVAPLRL